jgi:hypothetical protein
MKLPSAPEILIWLYLRILASLRSFASDLRRAIKLSRLTWVQVSQIVPAIGAQEVTANGISCDNATIEFSISKAIVTPLFALHNELFNLNGALDRIKR